jgi:hypothetical protein
MMDPTLMNYLVKERVNDLLREAEHNRLANSARDYQPRPARGLAIALPRLAWPKLSLKLARLRRNVAL